MVPPSFATATAVASPPRYRADPSGSRATFSLSCPVGLPADGPASLQADGGVLLTVSAVRGSLASVAEPIQRAIGPEAARGQGQRVRSSVTASAPSALASTAAFSPSRPRIASATSNPGRWVARNTNSPV